MEGNARINIWINEDRLSQLDKVGLSSLTKEVFAGMRVLEVTLTLDQVDRIMKLYPSAKYDTSTTNSVELLPRLAKDKLFDAVLETRSTGPEAVNRFLQSI